MTKFPEDEIRQADSECRFIWATNAFADVELIRVRTTTALWSLPVPDASATLISRSRSDRYRFRLNGEQTYRRTRFQRRSS